MKKNEEKRPVAQISDLEDELKQINRNARFRKLLKSTLYTLIVVSACAVLVAVIFLPILRIYGSSMNPTLTEGDIVVTVKNGKVETGDVIAVYYGSKLLIKRCMATEGQWVDIDEKGNVYVYDDASGKGEPLDESKYLLPERKSYGQNTNIDLPYQVPANSIFVMGDNRDTSVDSRNTSVGCIDRENIVGKIIFKVWPLSSFGAIG